MSEPAPPSATPEGDRPPAGPWGAFHPGRLLLGAALAALGVVWLLEALDLVDVELDVVVPLALIVVGVALLGSGAYGRSSGGLVTLGVVLTAVLVVTTIVRVPLTGGVGDRTERPQTFGDRAFELGVGNLTVDLSELAWEAGTDPDRGTIEAHVGIGQLVVVAPDAGSVPCVSVEAEAGLGQVAVFGAERGGVGPSYRTEAVCASLPALHLELSVGLGQVEVRGGG